MSNPPRLPNLNPPGIGLEYNSLRGEILKRIALRQQIISVTLTLAGVFLVFGLTTATVAVDIFGITTVNHAADKPDHQQVQAHNHGGLPLG